MTKSLPAGTPITGAGRSKPAGASTDAQSVDWQVRYPILGAVVGKALAEQPFHKVTVIARQHLMHSTLDGQFGAMFRLGLRPEDCFWLGKPYSTNPQVMRSARAQGIQVHKASLHGPASALRSNSAWHGFCASAADEHLRAAAAHARKLGHALLILDDGGLLTSTAQRLYSELNVPIAAVEQTGRGVRWFEGSARTHPLRLEESEVWKYEPGIIRFPIVAVAYSESKVRYETPAIAFSGITHMLARAKRQGIHRNDLLRQPVVIGGGVIGIAVKDLLDAAGWSPAVLDPSGHQFGLPGMFRTRHSPNAAELLSDASVVIECAGEDVLDRLNGWPGRPPLMVCSMSSENIGLQKLLSGKFGTFDQTAFGEAIDMERVIHDDVLLHNGDQLTVASNCLFPVNFDGSPDSMPTPLIEATRALMVVGGIDALSTTRRAGPRQLSRRWDNFVRKTTARALPDEVTAKYPGVFWDIAPRFHNFALAET